MEVSVLSHTPNADRLVCATARGDYMADSLVNVDLTNEHDYAEVMEGVSIRDHHRGMTDGNWGNLILYRKTHSFIEELLQRGHFGPFEHPQITFAIEGISRSCMAQLTRHRHATFDVQSMRYVNFEDADVIVPQTIEEAEGSLNPLSGENIQMEDMYLHKVEKAFKQYNSLVDNGVPEEDARMVLPIGTKVNLTATFNLRSLMHVIDMRHAGDAQWEARDVAQEMYDLAKEVAPITFKEYTEHAKGSSKKAP